MNRCVKWLSIIGCMVGYGELRVISPAAAGIGVAIATCALIYAFNDLCCRPMKKKRRMNDDE